VKSYLTPYQLGRLLIERFEEHCRAGTQETAAARAVTARLDDLLLFHLESSSVKALQEYAEELRLARKKPRRPRRKRT